MKRKHDNDDDYSADLTQNRERHVRAHLSQLRPELTHVTQTLTAGLKLARGFERQKLGRRVKVASAAAATVHDDGDRAKMLQRLEDEIQALKELDLRRVAVRYLVKKIRAWKPGAIGLLRLDGLEEGKRHERNADKAELNVLGRLFKSKPVREVVENELGRVRAMILELDLEDSGTASAEGRAKEVEAAGEVEESEKFVNPESRPERNFGELAQRREEAANINGEIEGEMVDDDNDEIEEDDRFDDRLASISDDDGESEGRIDPSTMRHSSVQSWEDLDHGRRASRIRPPVHPQSKQTDIAVHSSGNPDSSTNTTSFLPSLSLTGYVSGSGSDGPEHGDYDASQIRRKNRRGQRARRQIAEKKYGKDARHLGLKAKEGRDEGWDRRRGAVDARQGRGTGWGGGLGDKTGKKYRDASWKNVGGRPRENTGRERGVPNDNTSQPIHPSWEAARRRKEMMGIKQGIGGWGGKKIVFE